MLAGLWAKFLRQVAISVRTGHRCAVQIREQAIARIPDSEISEEPLRITYPPFDIAIVRVGETVFAIEDACNHAGASLTQGGMQDMCIVCPLHGYMFDIVSGALLKPKGLCGPQRTFRVEREGDAWLVFESPRVSL
jgi:3-phenylpropionate/trans-cinnamate dioxygenase ferredoxin component